jgi:hypothetical protein
LVTGQYEYAVPGALQSLRFSVDVYGHGRIELVPAYLLLAEANLGTCFNFIFYGVNSLTMNFQVHVFKFVLVL